MASSIVIKAKYGDTLRRFNANHNGGQLDLDIEGLKSKVRSLFNFPPNAELTLTYIDEDQDVVALIDDNDIRDLVRQALNPVRINVQLNTGKSDRPSSRSSAQKSPNHNTLPKTNYSVADLLKSVPEPFRDPLTTLSLEMASKATSSAPVLAELIDTFTKMGQAVLDSQNMRQPAPTNSRESGATDWVSAAGNDSAAPKDSERKVDGLVSSSDGSQLSQLGKGTSLPLKNEEASSSAMPNEKSPGNCASGDDKQKSTPRIGSYGVYSAYGNGKEAAPDTNSDSSVRKKCAKNIDVCAELPQQNGSKKFNPFVMPYVPPPFVFQPPRYLGGAFISADNSRSQGSVFHSGVCCDECGMNPIFGPRYKSKVRYNYDLCQICFEQKGNDSDYQRMDLPALHPHPWSFRAYSDGRLGQRVPGPFSVNPTAAGRCTRNVLRPRLESHFILDVNIADGTIMAPKTPFTKIWRMRNSGTLPWPRGVQLVWIDGDKFATTDSAEVEIPSSGLGVEEELDVAVDFVAPEVAGRYISYWRMASPSGQKFGQRVWVLIQVDPSLNDTVLDTTQTQGVDLNSPKFNQNPKPEPPLVDVGYFDAYDVDNNPTTVIEGQQQGASPGCNDPSQLMMYDPLLALSGTQPHPLRLQPPQTKTTSQSSLSEPNVPSLSIADSSKVSYPRIDADFGTAAPNPTNPNISMLPTMVSVPETSYPKNNVSMIPSAVTSPASSSTTLSYPKNNVFHIPTVDIVRTSQSGKGVADSGSLTTGQGNARGNDTNDNANEVEKALVNELVEMGFTELPINKEVLRKNNYNLEKSLDELCVGAEWIHHLQELHGMGFCDDELNKKVLAKNNGSLKHAVMDLISRENA